MKNLFQLIAIFTVVFIFNSCSKCTDQSTKTSYLDRSYLPDIIPYSDTSTRLFLKNGKDTLLFKSQGLNQSFEDGSTNSGGPDECSEYYSNEHLRLRMAATDTDFFDVLYFTRINSAPRGKLELYGFATDDFDYREFKYFYPPIVSMEINGIKYDTINVFPFKKYDSDPNNKIFIKSGVGIIKIQSTKVTYELIK